MNQIFIQKKKSRLRYFGNEKSTIIIYFFALDNELYYIGVTFCIIFTFFCIIYYIGLKKRLTWFLIPLIVIEITTNTIFTLMAIVAFMFYFVNRMGLIEIVDFLHNYIIYLCIGCFGIIIKDILVFCLIKGYFIMKKKNEHIIILQNETEYIKLNFTSRPTII
uniref:Uncharacterized protein n=1 Tax=Strongyloides stercoralis TaxID=6248 RepID=A0AAF5D0P5_STRER